MTMIRHGRPSSGSRTYFNADGDLITVGWISGPAHNPNRVPSKAAGRRGTRRAWKRAHPPGAWARLFDELFGQ